jgi:hypothetical protein
MFLHSYVHTIVVKLLHACTLMSLVRPHNYFSMFSIASYKNLSSLLFYAPACNVSYEYLPFNRMQLKI